MVGAGTCGEVRRPLLEERVTSLARLLAHVVEQGGVAGELLEPGETVGVRVECRFQAAQREWAVAEDVATPRHGLRLQPVERNDRVHQSHGERLVRVVARAAVPDLARLLVPDDACQVRGTVPAVEAPDARAGLAEDGVVGGDGQIADHVQHVAAPDRIARHHGDDGLRQGPDLPLQVEDVQPRHPVLVDVSAVAAHPLVAAGAEGVRSGAGEHDDPDGRIVARCGERVGQLDQRAGAERVPHLRALDGDPGDPRPSRRGCHRIPADRLDRRVEVCFGSASMAFGMMGTISS